MKGDQNNVKILEQDVTKGIPKDTLDFPEIPNVSKTIVENLARKRVVEDIILKEMSEWRAEYNDLAQDLYLDLLKKPENKLKILERTGLLRPFLVRTVKNNLHSSTSRFYYTYRKFGILNNGEESKEYREYPDSCEGIS